LSLQQLEFGVRSFMLVFLSIWPINIKVVEIELLLASCQQGGVSMIIAQSSSF
jgi:hypothetical protein